MIAKRWSLIPILAGLVALMTVAGSGNVSADPPGLARAQEVQDAHTDKLLSIEGVVGTAVGFGSGGAAPVIVVYTETPQVASNLPRSLDGFAVAPRVTGRFVALHHRPGHDGGPGGEDPPPPADCTNTTERCERPVPIGVSTGHPDITAGTIGARVTDGNAVYALSNNHVYANGNDASLGDAVIQPGTVDGGASPADDIGNLAAFEPIDFNGGDNTMDAAIALSSTANLGNSTPSFGGYGTPSSTIAGASVGQAVQKFGRTTGLTVGEVSEINVTLTVCYEGFPFCTKSAKFVDQIAIIDGTFSDGGDSGSLIVTNDANKNPVGLLFAGSSTRTIASRIDLVLTRFGVTIDGEGTTPEPPTLTSISVTPASPSIAVGQTQQFTATGTFDDESTADITSTATWTSSDTAVATIDGSGLATGVSAGTTNITASQDDVTSDPASLDVTAGGGGTVSVASIDYNTEGGRDGDKHLLVTVALEDNGAPVAGVSVSVRVDHDSGAYAVGTATTGSGGTVTFTWKNAPSTACFSTTVTDVASADWDGGDGSLVDPGFCRP